jgi:ABC-2 type transport system ATP-binding protein
VSTTDASIVVEHVNKTYYPSPAWMKALVRTNITEPVEALGDITLRVDPGEIVAVVGPNGAGKTTTFRILVGLTTPTKGRASVMGYDATKESVNVRSLVGWMPGDDRSLLMRLTCSENLRFHGKLQGLKGRGLERRISDSLETVGLGHAAEKTIFALSAGMRARLQLARALLHDPAVLVLDEPTGTIDPVASHGLLDLITDIVREKKLAAMISSHRLEEIEALQSRVILLDRGAIRYDGDLDSLRDRLDRPCLEVAFGQDETAVLAAKAIDSAGIAAAVRREGATVRYILDHGTPTGTVLTELAPFLTDIAHVNELQRPLRELLAEIYGSGEESEAEAGDASRSGRRHRKRQRQGKGRRQRRQS